MLLLLLGEVKSKREDGGLGWPCLSLVHENNSKFFNLQCHIHSFSRHFPCSSFIKTHVVKRILRGAMGEISTFQC